MSDVRYFKLKGLNFTNSHYLCEIGDSVIAVREDGMIHNHYNSDSYIEIQFAPDADLIEEEWINATDRPSVKLKYPELHPVNDVES